MDKKKFIEELGIIEKHLEKNEKWFQQPEKKMISYEKDMNEWNKRFMKTIGEIEKWVKEFEKKMEG
ncbi:hypothetical protein [Paucisalibacillus globulus]|uniref:hypothetical protein n=1 Tax=Paucisalibacillus globulus TaxID=351095 RepID=UPI000BB99C96|nr:hypothetical protein [Paucisalibacillus globulus]